MNASLGHLVKIRCQEKIFDSIEMVIFDKDGTLANSVPYLIQLGRSRAQCLDAHAPGVGTSLLKAFGFDDHGQLHPQRLLAVGSRYENEIAAATYVMETGKDWVQSVSIAQDAFREADKTMPPKASTTTLIHGVADLVRSLHQAQIQLGIISADITHNVVKFAQQYDLMPYCSCLAGVDTVDKSNPTACRTFFQQYDIDPSHILVIGDSGSDIRLAQSIGAHSIGVTWGWDGSFSIPGADAIAHHPTDIHIVSNPSV